MQKLVERTSLVVCKGVSVDETTPAVKRQSGPEVRAAPCFQAESCHSPRTRQTWKSRHIGLAASIRCVKREDQYRSIASHRAGYAIPISVWRNLFGLCGGDCEIDSWQTQDGHAEVFYSERNITRFLRWDAQVIK
jgi:hypothetical protein